MEIDELVWEHNRRSVLDALYYDEMCLVDSLSTTREKIKLLTLKMLNLTI